jgi:hypothetical protein
MLVQKLQEQESLLPTSEVDTTGNETTLINKNRFTNSSMTISNNSYQEIHQKEESKIEDSNLNSNSNGTFIHRDISASSQPNLDQTDLASDFTFHSKNLSITTTNINQLS